MSSEIKADKWSPASGTSATIGDSGDTYTVPTGANFTVTDELKTNKISPASGTTFTLGDSGDTFNIPSGATIANAGTATGFGESNTPYFEVKLSSQQDISDATKTLITFNSERFDSGNAFNTSTYKYTPQTAGKYIFTLVVYGLSSNAGNANTRGIIGYIDKNGSSVQINEFDFNNNDIRQGQCVTTATIDMNGSSDYVQFYGEVNTVDGVNGRLSAYTMARGWRLT